MPTPDVETDLDLAWSFAPLVPVDIGSDVGLRWVLGATVPGFVTTADGSVFDLEWSFLPDVDPPWDDTPLIDLTDTDVD